MRFNSKSHFCSKTIFFCTFIALVSSHIASAEDKKHNGFWAGKYTCSESIKPNSRNQNAYSSNITFTVDNNKGTARKENIDVLEKFDLNIRNSSLVFIESNGTSKDGLSRKWSIKASGSISGNKMQANGSMYMSDGSTVRERCIFLLANEEMTFSPSSPVQSSSAKPKISAAAKPVRQVVENSPLQSSVPKKMDTPAPIAVAASQNAPARVAAIANVEPGKATVQNSQFKKVTANPIDSQKKTNANDVWINFNPAITVQERQFCRIVENFRTEYAVAETTRNQIKINETLRGLTQSLNSLLPDGKLQGWVMRTVSISQATDGSAEVLLELPCGIYVGSNTCDADPKNFYGTAKEGTRIYSELAKMTMGDFALVSGQFVYSDAKAFDKNISVASFKYMKTGAHCKAKSIAANADFFGLKLEVLSTIK